MPDRKWLATFAALLFLAAQSTLLLSGVVRSERALAGAAAAGAVAAGLLCAQADGLAVAASSAPVGESHRSPNA